MASRIRLNSCVHVKKKAYLPLHYTRIPHSCGARHRIRRSIECACTATQYKLTATGLKLEYETTFAVGAAILVVFVGNENLKVSFAFYGVFDAR